MERLKIAGLFVAFPIVFPIHILVSFLEGGSGLAHRAIIETLEELPAAFKYVITGA